MKEADIQPFSTLPGNFVNEPYSIFLGIPQSFTHLIHGKGNVMDTLPLVGNKLADRPFGIGGLQKFNLGLTYFEKSSLNLLVGHLFHSITLQTVNLFIKGNRLLQVFHGNSNVLNMSNIHNQIFINSLSQLK